MRGEVHRERGARAWWHVRRESTLASRCESALASRNGTHWHRETQRIGIARWTSLRKSRRLARCHQARDEWRCASWVGGSRHAPTARRRERPPNQGFGRSIYCGTGPYVIGSDIGFTFALLTRYRIHICDLNPISDLDLSIPDSSSRHGSPKTASCVHLLVQHGVCYLETVAIFFPSDSPIWHSSTRLSPNFRNQLKCSEA